MPERRVMCVSFDRAVSETRCAALKQAGYLVTPTSRMEEALELLSSQKFDLIIVGHRFPTDDKRALAVEARDKWNTPVLLVCGVSADSEIPAAGRVYALEGTTGLVTAVRALLPTEAPAAPEAAA